MGADTRRRRVRALFIQAALWAPTMGEKDAIPPPRGGDADFQLSPTPLIVAPVVQVKSPPTLRYGNTEMWECLETDRDTFPYHTISPPSPSSHQIAPCARHFIVCTSLQRDFPQTRACLPHCAPCRHKEHRCTSGYTPPTGQRLGSALWYQRRRVPMGLDQYSQT